MHGFFSSPVALLMVLGSGDASLRDYFQDVLPFPGHKSRGAFSDRGAWHGFALPDKGSIGGFAGPFIHGTWMPGDHWLSPDSLVRFVPTVWDGIPTSGSLLQPARPAGANASFVPGLLRQEYLLGAFQVRSELIFVGRRTSAVRVSATNVGRAPASIRLGFNGTASIPLQQQDDCVLASNISQKAAGAQTTVRFQPSLGLVPQVSGKEYVASTHDSQDVAPSESISALYTVSFSLNASEHLVAQRESDAFFQEPESHFTANQVRWEGYLRNVVGEVGPEGPTMHQRVAAKAVSTLVLNWRGATGSALLHDGCTPSITGFSNGFWSWDSWKHAAGIATFDPSLAASQVQAMLDHQSKQSGATFVGMIPDKVGLPPDVGDAWGNTKPPLAAWAVASVYASGKDESFLREVFPKLEMYHRWWYQWRDHDRNGLCEFGSSGNNTMEMKWESGMDNAPRFDNTSMLKNADRAWSGDQESVDLNSFLYLEKQTLADLSGHLGNVSASAAYRAEAEKLQKLVQERFFDEQRGYFFDRRLGPNGTFVGPMGCEGFAPLWSGAASAAQAARVRQHLTDPTKFRTLVPFPCVAADAPQFRADGYWRGPVWLDQAYFAVAGLRKYGFTSEADNAITELLSNAVGLGKNDLAAPFTENYNPLTGARQGAEWFGWSAAHLLLLTAQRHEGKREYKVSV